MGRLMPRRISRVRVYGAGGCDRSRRTKEDAASRNGAAGRCGPQWYTKKSYRPMGVLGIAIDRFIVVL